MDTIEYLKQEIEKLDLTPKKEEIGEVLEVKDGVARISGVQNAESFEVLKFESSSEDVYGLALNLEENEVGAIVLGDFSNVKEGDIVKRTEKVISLPVGEDVVGRVVDPLGRPIDGKGEIKQSDFYNLERMAPSVIDRESVNFPLHTGLKVVDSLIPIGRGQRELVLGDRVTQKTSLTIDTIINQKKEPRRPICIYVAVGKREAELARIVETLKQKGAMEYTIVVAASASDPAPFWYLAPYAGTALGEYFMDNGKDALVIFDDLTKHAWAWREISLILKRSPGREAYPGDVFYIHSKLLERAAKLNKERGGGSLTALPLIETQAGDLTTYIPTNVISICDGQIYMDTSLYLQGQKPEVNIGLSVSRVGSSAQTKAMKKVAGDLKLEMAQFQELESFLEFAEEVGEETKIKIDRGRKMKELLKQDYLSPLSFEKQVAIIRAGIKGFLQDVNLEDVKNFEKDLLEYIDSQKPQVIQEIKEKRELNEDMKMELDKVIRAVVEKYTNIDQENESEAMKEKEASE